VYKLQKKSYTQRTRREEKKSDGHCEKEKKERAKNQS
jgi:hypothetical protein